MHLMHVLTNIPAQNAVLVVSQRSQELRAVILHGSWQHLIQPLIQASCFSIRKVYHS